MRFIKNKLDLRMLFWNAWTDLYKYYDIFDKVEEEMKKYEGYKIYEAIISVKNKNCYLDYSQKIEYIRNFNNFKNTDCLYKYMSEREELKQQLEYLKDGEINEFYNLICNKGI